jgi:glycosyltransferase involved in cell wall biosynthesis
MRIAYIINSAEGGGAAAVTPPVIRFLREQGHEVRLFILTPKDRNALPVLQATGAAIHLREGGHSDHAATLLWLLRQIRAWKPTYLWTSLTRATLLGQIVGRITRTPVISWQHNAWLKPANLFLLRKMSRLSDIWIGDSDHVTALTKTRLNIPAERLFSWPVFSVRPDAPQAQAWLPGETIRIGSLGRLHDAKGYDILLKALSLLREDTTLPAFHVEIAGEGSKREELEKQAALYAPGKVYFSGFCQDSDRFLANLHLYLQPSRREGFCIATHEALQAGLPVIATDVGELKHSLSQSGAGLCIPVENPTCLAQALKQLLGTPEHLHALGLKGRNWIRQRYSEDDFRKAGSAILAAAEQRLPTN